MSFICHFDLNLLVISGLYREVLDFFGKKSKNVTGKNVSKTHVKSFNTEILTLL